MKEQTDVTIQKPLWKYAGMLAQRICFPAIGANMNLLMTAIQTEMGYSRCSPEDATRFIANEVIRDREERGETIDCWYFTDGRWRNKRLSKMERKQLERVQTRNAAMRHIMDGIAAEQARRQQADEANV